MSLDADSLPEFISHELLSQLYIAADDDEEFVGECVELFIETVDERMPDLDASVAAGDHENTYVHAHFVGSSCGNVGAQAMLAAARATEAAAKANDADGVAAHYEELKTQYALAKDWFTAKYLSK